MISSGTIIEIRPRRVRIREAGACLTRGRCWSAELDLQDGADRSCPSRARCRASTEAAARLRLRIALPQPVQPLPFRGAYARGPCAPAIAPRSGCRDAGLRQEPLWRSAGYRGLVRRRRAGLGRSRSCRSRLARTIGIVGGRRQRQDHAGEGAGRLATSHERGR